MILEEEKEKAVGDEGNFGFAKRKDRPSYWGRCGKLNVRGTRGSKEQISQSTASSPKKKDQLFCWRRERGRSSSL